MVEHGDKIFQIPFCFMPHSTNSFIQSLTPVILPKLISNTFYPTFQQNIVYIIQYGVLIRCVFDFTVFQSTVSGLEIGGLCTYKDGRFLLFFNPPVFQTSRRATTFYMTLIHLKGKVCLFKGNQGYRLSMPSVQLNRLR